MRTQSEVAMKDMTMFSHVESIQDFRERKRDEVALLVRCLLKREGLESDVRYSTGGLSIAFRGPSPDFTPDDPAGLLGVLMAVADLLEEEHKVGPEFVIYVDFWGNGCMVTTVGKAMELTARMRKDRLTADDFQGVFDFRLGRMPVRLAAAL